MKRTSLSRGSTRYFAGQALTGSETRTSTLNFDLLRGLTGVVLYPGTFNVALIDEITLPLPKKLDTYNLWPCRVSTAEMIERDETGYAGWILGVRGERLPDYFIEVISKYYLRDRLKRLKWPAFPVEIALECRQEGRNIDEQRNIRIRRNSAGADSARND